MKEFNNRPGHWVSLDADDQGARLCSLAEYHTWITDQWHSGEVENDDFASTVYMLGNIEGRLLHNHVTMDDVELMDLWFAEMHPHDTTSEVPVVDFRSMVAAFVGLLEWSAQDTSGETHMEILDAYFTVCALSGIDDKTATIAIHPGMTEEEYAAIQEDDEEGEDVFA